MDKEFKVLYLTNNEVSMPLADWIAQKCNVTVVQDKINLDMVSQLSPDLIVSYNYTHIVKADVLDYMKGRSINLHISMLPWNKGADPNFWSFVEDTPKGVTIHQMTAGLDAGAFLYQRECAFDPTKETFATTYRKLHAAIQDLFQEHWDKIRSFQYELIPQQGTGSYHKHSQFLELKEKVPFEWDDFICDYLMKYHKYKKEMME